MTTNQLCNAATIILLFALGCATSRTPQVAVNERVAPGFSNTYLEKPQATTLVGLWESAETSMGGIGDTLEFRSDGTFVKAITVIVDLHYRVVGDRLVVAEQPPAGDADAGNSSQIKVDDNVLVETNPDGSVVRKERLGSSQAGKPTIVGVWRYRHYSGAIAFERYTADGTLFLRIPMKSSSGRYALNHNELLLTPPRQAEVKVKVELRGDEILFSESTDRTTIYRRASGGPWYDREHIDYQPPK